MKLFLLILIATVAAQNSTLSLPDPSSMVCSKACSPTDVKCRQGCLSEGVFNNTLTMPTLSDQPTKPCSKSCLSSDANCVEVCADLPALTSTSSGAAECMNGCHQTDVAALSKCQQDCMSKVLAEQAPTTQKVNFTFATNTSAKSGAVSRVFAGELLIGVPVAAVTLLC